MTFRKVMWSYDGKESKTRVIVRDDNKICSECSGYDGHFNECSKLKEIELQERLDEACRNDKSHTKELSKN